MSRQPPSSSRSSNAQNCGYTLDEKRRAVLDQLDNAPLNLFHVKVCFVAGIGFFTDAYDLFAINITSTMLGYVYGSVQTNSTSKHGASLTPNQDLLIKIASPVGTLVGQLVFGWLADIVGRKRMYGVELCIMIVATFVQALAGNSSSIDIIGVLAFWRFIMGIGVGGDYPLSAVISSEFASVRSRGRLMTIVFAAQGWGQFSAAVISGIVVSAFHTQIKSDPLDDPRHVDKCWRLIIGLGCIPAALALYFRLTIPETPRFTMDIEQNVKQASQDVDNYLTPGPFVIEPDAVLQRAAPKASRRDFVAYFRQWANGKILLGTCVSWFALDVAFYGLGLNSSVILPNFMFGRKNPSLTGGALIYQSLLNVSIVNMVLSVLGLIPGYYATFLLIDTWGRKPIQFMGFTMLTAIFIIMSVGESKGILSGNKNTGAFVFLYCLSSFFQNCGPNTTTFIIPGEAFPTRYRSTAHGISAAAGKLGAIISQVIISKLLGNGETDEPRQNFIGPMLGIFAGFMFVGIFSTLLLPETRQRTLEDISNENQENFIQGVIDPIPLEEYQGARNNIE